MKFLKASKKGENINIEFKVWFKEEVAGMDQKVLLFHFTDGVSDSKKVNELFSQLSRYVKARENLKIN